MAASKVRVVLSVVEVLVVMLIGCGAWADIADGDTTPCQQGVAPTAQSYCHNNDCYIAPGNTTGTGICNPNANTNGALGAQCSSAVSIFQNSQKDLNKACSDAQMTTGCVATAEQCQTAGMKTSPLDTTSLQAMGFTIPSGQGSTSCPTEDYSQFESQQSKFQDKIDSLQTQSADIDKQIADAKSSIDDKLSKANADILQARKDLQQLQTDTNGKQRQAASDALSAQQDDATAIQKLADQKLQAEQNMSKCDQQFANDEINFGNATMNQTNCLGQIKQAKSKLEASGAAYSKGNGTTISANSSMSSSSQEKAALQAAFNACLQGIQQQWTTAQQTHNSCLEQGQTALLNNQESVANAQQKAQTDNANAAGALQDLKTTLSNAQQNEMQTEQNAQQELQNAEQTAQQQQQALQKKQATLQMQMMQYQQQLTALGQPPKPGVKAGWSGVISSTTNYNEDLDHAKSVCCDSSGDAYKGTNAGDICGIKDVGTNTNPYGNQ